MFDSQVKASEVPSPFGFKELLETIDNMRLCERHNSEIKYYCNDDKQELCDICWKEEHMRHHIELLEVAKLNQLSPHWERRMLEVRSR